MQSTLAERLKAAMAGPPKVSGRALASACGVKPPSVSDWLTGKSKTMEGGNLIAAAKHLRVRPEWLAEGVGPMRIDYVDRQIDRVEEPGVAYLPSPKVDKLTEELLLLFSELDASSKRDFLNQLRGFVAGRRPHPVGSAPALAASK